MHLEVRNRPDYLTLVKSGVTKAIAYSVVANQVLGWDALNIRNRLDVIRYRKPCPLLCPHCGSASVLMLYNVSGKYLDTDTDYEWCCRSCGHLKYIFMKEPGTSRRLLRMKRKEALQDALPAHFFGIYWSPPPKNT